MSENREQILRQRSQQNQTNKQFQQVNGRVRQVAQAQRVAQARQNAQVRQGAQVQARQNAQVRQGAQGMQQFMQAQRSMQNSRVVQKQQSQQVRQPQNQKTQESIAAQGAQQQKAQVQKSTEQQGKLAQKISQESLDQWRRQGKSQRKKLEKNQQRRWRFALGALGVFALCTVLGIVGLSSSVAEIRDVEIAQTPTALLANAGAKSDKVITLPVTYYDQISDVCDGLYDEKGKVVATDRQWEWGECDYKTQNIEQGLASETLNENGQPTAQAGRLVPNRGLNFANWFTAEEGISAMYPGTLAMHYQKEGAEFSFVADDFYPLDDVKYSEGDPVNEDKHNHLFTMNFAVPFTVLGNGEEKFSITADDDTWVYLDGKLVVDMGGIHGPIEGAMVIDTDGKVYAQVDGGEWKEMGVTVTPGTKATLAVFHADRDASDSAFEIHFSQMNLELNEGTQIAAVTGSEAAGSLEDGFAQPLGETKVFQPDAVRSLVLVSTIEGVMIVVAAVMVVVVARYLVRQKVEE